MQFLWNQIDVSNPIWKDPADAKMYVTRRNQHRLHQFLMALHDDFEPVCVQLLHRSHLSTLDTAIFELVHAENRSQTIRSQPSHIVLATPSSDSSSFQRKQHLIGRILLDSLLSLKITITVSNVPSRAHYGQVLE
jgi:hypothetical protein